MAIQVQKDGNRLTILVDLSSGVPSASGKTLVLATTSGFQPIESDPSVKISLNVIKSRRG